MPPSSTQSGRRRSRKRFLTPFCDLLNRLHRFDADQFLVQAAEEVTQAVGVQAELVQDRGVQAFDVQRVFDGA